MFVQQISVFVENRRGRIKELTSVLSKNNVDLLNLSIADTSEYGIVRLISRDNQRAFNVLKDAGFTVSMSNLIGVKVADTPGGLATVLDALDSQNCSIEYLYSFTHTSDGNAIILLRVIDEQNALEALQKAGVCLVKDSIC